MTKDQQLIIDFMSDGEWYLASMIPYKTRNIEILVNNGLIEKNTVNDLSEYKLIQ